jgi:hypothetical protein
VLDDLISVLRELRHVPLVAAEVRRMLGCAEIERLRAELRALGEDRLELHGWKAFSQGDEDGILAEIFGRVGVRHHTFVEIGAGSGLENNPVYLLQQGWRGLWVEAGKRNSRRIAADFEQPLASGQLKLAAVAATAENVNALVAEAQLAGEIDLLSVDVDGVDLYIWEALEAVTPRVVVIEYNGALPATSAVADSLRRKLPLGRPVHVLWRLALRSQRPCRAKRLPAGRMQSLWRERVLRAPGAGRSFPRAVRTRAAVSATAIRAEVRLWWRP